MLKYVVAHFEKNKKVLESGEWRNWVLLPYKLPPLSCTSETPTNCVIIRM